ncbi:glycosyltransferase family 2 protein [Glycomyces tarimensis]
MSTRVPDVTVITAVYNTMPYVTRCVESVLEQTLGTDRIELIAVDDGSTDTGGAELDRFAKAHPGTIKVVHQANSGGPANPSNAALELATGRYLFFLGSDDYLGPETLERMVNCADEHSSDVVMGLMVGVGGRRAPQTAFEQPGTDVPFPLSKLVWALSNTKLFRRDLVERLNLRFHEDVSVYSDVPFTIEAMAHARKVSNLTDYEYYYTVERENAANVTYSSKLSERLFATRRIVDTICRLYSPGPERDALLYRTFAYEQWILLQEGFVALDDAGRREICDGVAALADAHLTDEMRRRLPVQKRVRLAHAQRRDISRLIEAIEFVEPVPFTVEAGRAFARYTGFRDEAAGLDDETFELLGDKVTVRFARGVRPRYFVWTGVKRAEYALEYSFSLPVEGIDPEAVKVGLVRLKEGKNPRKRTARTVDEDAGPQIAADIECEADGDETVVTARIPCEALTSKAPGRWSLRGYIALGDFVYDLPLKSPHDNVQRQGNPRGLSVEWGQKRALAIRVDEKATRRGLARLGISIGRK